MARTTALGVRLRWSFCALFVFGTASLLACQAKPEPDSQGVVEPVRPPEMRPIPGPAEAPPPEKIPDYCGDDSESVEAGVLPWPPRDTVPPWMEPLLRRRVGNSFDTWVAMPVADINGDGRKDYVVTADNAGWCGSGGCATFAVVSIPDGWRFYELDNTDDVKASASERERWPVVPPLGKVVARRVTGTISCEDGVCDVLGLAPTQCSGRDVEVTRAWFPRSGAVAAAVTKACPEDPLDFEFFVQPADRSQCEISGTVNESAELVSVRRVRKLRARQ